MQIIKPKIFQLPQNPDPGVALWGERTITRQSIRRIEYFNRYNVFLDSERWDVSCSGIRISSDMASVRNLRTHLLGYEPIRVEWYNHNLVSYGNTQLSQWIQDTLNPNIFDNPHRKKNLRFEGIDNHTGFIIYGATLHNIQDNSNLYQFFDIDPIYECDIYFDRVYLL